MKKNISSKTHGKKHSSSAVLPQEVPVAYLTPMKFANLFSKFSVSFPFAIQPVFIAFITF